MDRYDVKLTRRALGDLDVIYDYIAHDLREPGAALRIVDLIEEAVLSLETLPYRYPERLVGRFAGKGYRQLFVRNYTLVYRVDEAEKLVLVVTVRYSMSQF